MCLRPWGVRSLADIDVGFYLEELRYVGTAMKTVHNAVGCFFCMFGIGW